MFLPYRYIFQRTGRPRFSFIRKHPVFSGIFCLIAILIFASWLPDIDRSPKIGVIEVNGIILESESTIKEIRTFEKNPLIKGIMIHINSPGGAVAPSQEIFSEILRVRKKKKVYASISTVAASGGYYIAVAAEKIFSNPGSLTGSIGVIIQNFNVENLMSKIGVKSQVIKSGKNKDLGSSFRSMKSEERKLLEAVISDTHEQFVQAIFSNRNIEIKKLREVADGRVFTGKQAFSMGFVDQLASFRESIDGLKADLNLTGEIGLIYPPKIDESILLQFLQSTLSPIKDLLTKQAALYLYQGNQISY